MGVSAASDRFGRVAVIRFGIDKRALALLSPLPPHACQALEIAARDEKFETEGSRVRKDGSVFMASVVVEAIKDEHGRLIGQAKVTRDITDRKTAQDALEATASEQT